MARVKTDTRLWKALRKKLAQASKSEVAVGVLASEGGLEQRESGISMIELAAIHEFGSPAANIPERSFIRRTFKNDAAKFRRLTKQLAERIVAGNLSVEQALELLGAAGVSAVKGTITKSIIPPPLKQGTIDRKGSSRPLLDTGQLLNSIHWLVR